jgi:hypothetical protein
MKSTDISLFKAMLTAQPQTDAHFGGCPICGCEGNFLNIGRDHWVACPYHRTKWCIGSNLFSSWREEKQADWDRNARELSGYVEVRPIFPKPTEEELLQREKYEAFEKRCREIDRGYGLLFKGGKIIPLGPTDSPFDFGDS